MDELVSLSTVPALELNGVTTDYDSRLVRVLEWLERS
jgi:hypothetical protein